ncbi:hypothetical protein [Methanosarcina sp.]|uniref:hypothetical protein n=1 Tax=Methanosarcina sp. TaxID=2213 RepID=UPI002988CD0A|nr:hypothetical protein [Methanosarcina sp.]MDW5550878.1 hypothetical protein [Methanosarcina sp.]MDW5555849.1 hypothetical protein [Methanosarcina sp.]MDW5561418.1 hypothetical protein [Methanosarcina sp.]
MAFLEEIFSFENFKQIISLFQSISIPEHYYLENWIVYYTALKILLSAAIILYGSFILLKSFIFRYTMMLDGLRVFTFQASRFFAHFSIVFLIFGAILLILGLPVPDEHELSYLVPAFLILGTVFSFSNSRDSQFLGVICFICLWLCACFFALTLVYTECSNEINGHIFAYMDSDYKNGDPISVKVGGPDTGLSVFLSRDEPGGLKQISSLHLYSNNSSTQFNDTLLGYSQAPGDYQISLNNTTSLPSGHYRLMFENPKYKWINLSKPFKFP